MRRLFSIIVLLLLIGGGHCQAILYKDTESMLMARRLGQAMTKSIQGKGLLKFINQTGNPKVYSYNMNLLSENFGLQPDVINYTFMEFCLGLDGGVLIEGSIFVLKVRNSSKLVKKYEKQPTKPRRLQTKKPYYAYTRVVDGYLVVYIFNTPEPNDIVKTLMSQTKTQ